MASGRMASPDRHLALRVLRGTFRWLASLELAVVLIAATVLVLAWAAFYLDSRYGNSVVHFAVYGSSWFAALGFLLGLNVLCAALIRLPWKKHQTGFVITHAGIIVMLVGCLLTRARGIDAQLPVFEGDSGYLAFEETQHFQLTVYPKDGPSGEPAVRPPIYAASAASESPGSEAPTFRVPFDAGPFNWEDYRRRFWFPWQLSRRDQGLLYDRDGIRLEVLDYYADSQIVAPSPLRLRVKSRRSHGATPEGSEDAWQDVDLTVQGLNDPNAPRRRTGVGGHAELAGGAQIDFWVARTAAETEAFLDSRPEMPLEKEGLIVLHAQGRKFQIPARQFQQKSRVPLGDTGLHVELIRYDETFRGVLLQVMRAGQRPRRMLLLADSPYLDQQDYEDGVFGTYWCEAAAGSSEVPGDATAAEVRRRAGQPRIDILQGVDERLYYRVWKSPDAETAAPLPADGSRVTVLQKARGVSEGTPTKTRGVSEGTPTESPLTFYVAAFEPHDRPGQRIRPLPFASKKSATVKRRQARVRLTVDGKSEEFWLEGLPASSFPGPPPDEQRKVVYGEGRRVALSLAWDAVDVGFRVFLHRFERKLDPGTSMPSHYGSLVDFRDRDEPDKVLQPDVQIKLNAPVDFADPASGRSYRLFQESFAGPWKPGDPEFDQLVRGASARDLLFMSSLAVNYDPGRGLKYLGSLMVIAGIATMYYMKAYFFKRRRASAAAE